MIRLFASDLDGTLLNAHHQFDERIVDGIRRLLAEGGAFGIATGRGNKQCAIPEIESDVYKICMNGALILDKNDAVLAMSCVPKPVLARLLDELPEYAFDFVTPDKTYTRYSKETYFTRKVDTSADALWKERFMRDFLPRIQFAATKQQILDADVCKINLRVDPGMDTRHLDAFLAVHEKEIANAPSGSGLYELTAHGVNKGQAVLRLGNRLGIDPDEIAVYGDGGNDLEMLGLFEHAYAPANASETAKQKAKDVIGPSDQYSVITHMQKTLGIES